MCARGEPQSQLSQWHPWGTPNPVPPLPPGPFCPHSPVPTRGPHPGLYPRVTPTRKPVLVSPAPGAACSTEPHAEPILRGPMAPLGSSATSPLPHYSPQCLSCTPGVPSHIPAPFCSPHPSPHPTVVLPTPSLHPLPPSIPIPHILGALNPISTPLYPHPIPPLHPTPSLSHPIPLNSIPLHPIPSHSTPPSSIPSHPSPLSQHLYFTPPSQRPTSAHPPPQTRAREGGTHHPLSASIGPAATFTPSNGGGTTTTTTTTHCGTPPGGIPSPVSASCSARGAAGPCARPL